MTPDQIIHARRSAVLDYVAKVGVTAACSAAGISRTTYYRWMGRAERYGLAALLPKQRNCMRGRTPGEMMRSLNIRKPA